MQTNGRRPVTCKADFVGRYLAGEFGNASPSWAEPDTFIHHGHQYPADQPVPGLYHLRNRRAGGMTYYNLSWSATVAKWLTQYRKADWYASQMAPTDLTILQGEVYRSEQGLCLNYSLLALPMREALARQSLHAYRSAAAWMLRQRLCLRSYDWLEYLLDAYPDHVVEFSTYSQEWGTVPGYNTVFWEIRAY